MRGEWPCCKALPAWHGALTCTLSDLRGLLGGACATHRPCTSCHYRMRINLELAALKGLGCTSQDVEPKAPGSMWQEPQLAAGGGDHSTT
jgi:hypothetical protein